jgi:hypothetical protein
MEDNHDDDTHDDDIHGGQGRRSRKSKLVALAVKLATGSESALEGGGEDDLEDDVAIALAALEAGGDIDEAQDHFEDWRNEDNDDICADLFDKRDHENVSSLEASVRPYPFTEIINNIT